MSQIHKVTGLMSGSSLDGVDLATCEFWKERKKWNFTIVASHTIPYPASLRKSLEEAISWDKERINQLDCELGHYFSELIIQFHAKYKVAPELIASHGHTIFHDPGHGNTFQAGNGKIMADRTGIRVVNDFRREDVDQGGEGAPLVPVGDRLLFGDCDACLNLGGFANISFENENRQRIAFDICPVNLALNWVAGLIGKEYDHNGEIARTGLVNKPLLEALNSIEFYGTDPPKSLGKEWFLDAFLPIISNAGLPENDLMATVAEHISIQIASAAQDAGIGEILTTGGGTLNQFLLERLIHHTPARIVVPDQVLIQFKEAMVFAFLGLLKALGEVNCYASVTGGNNDISTGIIHNPKSNSK
jgi:anhydro-N-acetylmuramic acid kinase